MYTNKFISGNFWHSLLTKLYKMSTGQGIVFKLYLWNFSRIVLIWHFLLLINLFICVYIFSTKYYRMKYAPTQIKFFQDVCKWIITIHFYNWTALSFINPTTYWWPTITIRIYAMNAIIQSPSYMDNWTCYK